ncbi:capsid assembly scaffolding protein Gp46 family protein [Companilactobacillus nodensis]|nr:DUF4355 domain-containing protein [Companilactobacillus nodensis]
MMTFKTIETQEELDQIIQGRLDRQKESLVKQYSDYDDLKKQVSTLTNENTSLQSTISKSKEKYADYDQNIENLNSKISGYETANLKTKIALENGLPYDLADRLVGDDEESLKADAERLAGFVKKDDPVPPLKDPEPNTGSDENSAYKNLIDNLEGE